MPQLLAIAPITLSSLAFALALLVYADHAARFIVILILVAHVLWFTAAALLAIRGFFGSAPRLESNDFTDFVLLALTMAAPIVVAVLVWQRSAQIREILRAVPVQLLVALQTARVGGGVFVWLGYRGDLPLAYALAVGALDLAVGLSAPVLAWRARNPQVFRALRYWVYLGLLDFVVAVGWFLAMFPLPWVGALLPSGPGAAELGRLPLSLLAIYAVPFGTILHLLVLDRLARTDHELHHSTRLAGWLIIVRRSAFLVDSEGSQRRTVGYDETA